MTAWGKEAAAACATRVEKMKPAIIIHSIEFNLHPAIVAGVITRETSALSRFCLPPNQGGQLGDGGKGHGPMQIDVGSFPEWCAGWRASAYSTADGIRQGCYVLREKLDEVAKRFPVADAEAQVRYAVAAYNCGTGGVAKALKAGLDVDARTTGHDYSRDVIERAKFFTDNGFAIIE